MGRHSAPDDDAPDTSAPVDERLGGATAVAVVTAPDRGGRHARFDDESPVAELPDAELPDAELHGADTAVTDTDVTDTAVIEPVPDQLLAPAEQPAPPEQAAPTGDRPRIGGSRSDLQLLRRHGDVRARVIAGVVVPFAVFTVVMALLNRLDRSYLIWIWIPLVTAGVLGGLFLDLGHRRYPARDDHEPGVASPG